MDYLHCQTEILILIPIRKANQIATLQYAELFTLHRIRYIQIPTLTANYRNGIRSGIAILIYACKQAISAHVIWFIYVWFNCFSARSEQQPDHRSCGEYGFPCDGSSAPASSSMPDFPAVHGNIWEALSGTFDLSLQTLCRFKHIRGLEYWVYCHVSVC